MRQRRTGPATTPNTHAGNPSKRVEDAKKHAEALSPFPEKKWTFDPIADFFFMKMMAQRSAVVGAAGANFTKGGHKNDEIVRQTTSSRPYERRSAHSSFTKKWVGGAKMGGRGDA